MDASDGRQTLAEFAYFETERKAIEESKAYMSDKNKTDGKGSINGAEQWPGIDSRYRLIVVAALRSKQLLHGATPRIEADARRHRNISIALEEVKRGLVPFTTIVKE